ncbi:hypothetical protein HK101_009047 [Irineochytrium annulatum]|nr:hypothetical protein HK101_009047 [Irineochytrium annulatum]
MKRPAANLDGPGRGEAEVATSPLSTADSGVSMWRPRKKAKRNHAGPASSLLISFGSLASHPQGVKPLGNLLLATDSKTAPPCREPGLGALSPLSDDLLLSMLSADSNLLRPSDLCRLARCSRALYVLACHDDLWRGWMIRTFAGDFGAFRRSWRDTFRARSWGSRDVPLAPTVDIKVEGFYSDFLYSSWRCASVPLRKLCRADARNSVERRYSTPNKPVILTDVVPSWPAYAKWDLPFLQSRCDASVLFRAEAVDLNLQTYLPYSTRCAANGASFEESPLYLFDKHFADRTDLASDYTVPPHFAQHDLFSVLGKERPDHRWLIIGPPRSGSTFHLDPNATSAWNAVIRGSKKWVLFPPESVPPGVYPSKDGGEVASPVSLAEWFLNHYDEARRTSGFHECVCAAGEVIYVPSGWWHCVMNLEETIAITQNFVDRGNLKRVLRFLATKRDQVSGVDCSSGVAGETLYERFVGKLKKEWDGVVREEVVEREETEKRRRDRQQELDASSGLFIKKITGASIYSCPKPEVEDGGFRFSFF